MSEMIKQNNNTPQTVSLCVVAYNEEYFLPNLLTDLSNQTHPHELIELVLIDGCSTDGTKRLMTDFADRNSPGFCSIIVLDNEKRIQAAGWNVALMHATGDVIIRIDAHTSIPAEFTALNMKSIQDGEYVSGGIRPCLIEDETPWRATLLKTENSLFGSSIAKSKIGRFMRELSIDEIPQFLNVLFGQMSLIGPRPDPPDWLDKYPEDIKVFLTVRPGITGYSQAYFRNGADSEEKMRNDAYYALHCSFLLDVKIVFKTIITVLGSKNTYKNTEQESEAIQEVSSIKESKH